MALLVDQGQQVAGLHHQEVQDFLVVPEPDAGPGDTLPLVLLLLLLEDVTHEELLQLLVSQVDEQLLEAAGRMNICSAWKTEQIRSEQLWGVGGADLFLWKFSNPKISSRPMDSREDLEDLSRFLWMTLLIFPTIQMKSLL